MDMKTLQTSAGVNWSRLAARVRGPVLTPDHPDYDRARTVWNAMIERHPGAILRPGGVADVSRAVSFAAENRLPLSVRGGGHNIAGLAVCEGGLMIDFSQLRGVRVDANSAVVHIEPGATWGDVDRATRPFGLVVPSGIVSATGVAGLTLGGGFGWLTGRYGLTCDNLVAADVVTADGMVRRASAQENPELFWALRGGGGNFGIVTSFEFRGRPLGAEVMAGMVVYPMVRATEVIERFRDVTRSAPAELGCLMALRNAPAAPFIPSDWHGKPVAAIAACYSGSLADGAEATAPLRSLGGAVADNFGPKPFPEFQTLFDAGEPFGRRYYWKSDYFDALPDAAIRTLVRHADPLPSPASGVLLMHLGGVPGDVEPEATAVPVRSPYVLNVKAAWGEPVNDSRLIAWARAYWQAMSRYSNGGAYLNFLNAGEDAQRVRAAYGRRALPRLEGIKARLDPENLFSMNHPVQSGD